MKLISATCLLILVNASDAFTSVDEFRKHVEDCRKSLGLENVADYKSIFLSPVGKAKDGYCSYACAFKKAGIMAADNSIDGAKIAGFLSGSNFGFVTGQLSSVANKCKTNANENVRDECEALQKWCMCFSENIPFIGTIQKTIFS